MSLLTREAKIYTNKTVFGPDTPLGGYGMLDFDSSRATKGKRKKVDKKDNEDDETVKGEKQ